MGKFTKAFKEARVTFKETLERQKSFAEYKRNLDTLMDAIALVPIGVDVEALKQYVRSEIACYEHHVGAYERKSEIEVVGQPEPIKPEKPVDNDITLAFADDGTITVAEEIEQ